MTRKTVMLSILCFAFAAKSMGEIKFETLQIARTYGAMPENIRQQIGTMGKTSKILNIDDIIENGKINLIFNPESEISHLGLALNSVEEDTENKDAVKFVENLLLNLLVSKEGSFVFNYIKHNDIRIFINNEPVRDTPKTEWKRTIKQIVPSEVTIKKNKSTFYATWMPAKNSAVVISFPADINLIKGMNKDELEKDFIRTLASYSPDEYKQSNYPNKNITPTGNGLYILKGRKFETDDFRSDIYFTEKNAGVYLPVFSSKFPVESFSNLFIANIEINPLSEITFVLYGNKKETKTFNFNKINSFLAKSGSPFFGISSNTPNGLKATIIYYNPTYKYLHMLIAETEKNDLFAKIEKTIKCSLYLYVPRADLKKDVLFDKTNNQSGI